MFHPSIRDDKVIIMFTDRDAGKIINYSFCGRTSEERPSLLERSRGRNGHALLPPEKEGALQRLTKLAYPR